MKMISIHGDLILWLKNCWIVIPVKITFYGGHKFVGLFILYDDLLFAEVHNVESLWIWFQLKHFYLLDLFPHETAQDKFFELRVSDLLTVIIQKVLKNNLNFLAVQEWFVILTSKRSLNFLSLIKDCFHIIRHYFHLFRFTS